MASLSIPIAIAATPILFNCSTWSFIMESRARKTTMIMETELAFPFIREISHEKSWKITSGKDCKDIFHTDHISMQSFSSLRRQSTWGKYFSMLFITDFNTASLVERSLTAAISHILSASVLLSVDKISQNYPIRSWGYTKILLSLPMCRCSFASSHHAFLIFLPAVFRTAPQLTECLEEGFWRFTYRNTWRGLGAQKNSVETCACGSSSKGISCSSKPLQTIT